MKETSRSSEQEPRRRVGEHLIGRYQTCVWCESRFDTHAACVAAPCTGPKGIAGAVTA